MEVAQLKRNPVLRLPAVTQPWKDPDLSDEWEVSEITGPSAFVRFVVERAPVGSTWIVSAHF